MNRILIFAMLVLSPLVSRAATVYYDNSATAWSQPYVYCWDKSNESDKNHEWAGEAMTQGSDGLWYYTYDISNWTTPMIIFDDGGSNQSVDLTFTDGATYGLVNGKDDKSDGKFNIAEIDTSSTTKWTVYFETDETYNWSTVYVYLWDETSTKFEYNGWYGAPMAYDSESGKFVLTFYTNKLTESSNIIFDDGNSGTENQSGDLTLTDNATYNHDGVVEDNEDGNEGDESGNGIESGTECTIYYDNSATAWKTPYVYCWDKSNDSNKNHAWPGEQMTQQSNGLWYYTFTTTSDWTTPMIIFDDGTESGGSVDNGNQTNDLSFTDTDGAIYNESGVIDTDNTKEWVVYFETDDEESENWGTIYVHLWDTSDYNAWPGAPMAYDTSIGKYVLTFYTNSLTDGTSNIMFDDGKDGDKSEDKTGDLTLINGATYNHEGLVDDESGNEGDESGNGIESGTECTVYYDNSATAWETPYVYCWDKSNDSNKNHAWPGEQMTQQSNGLWYYTFTTTSDWTTPMIIFDDGTESGGSVDNGNQTNDLSFTDTDGAIYNESGVIDTDNTKEWVVYFVTDTSHNWTSVYVHLWDTSDYNAWPGAPMYYDSESQKFVLTFYTNSLTDGSSYVMFDDGNGDPVLGTDKTNDLTLVNGTTYTHSGSSTGTDTGEGTTYTVYYDNSDSSWETPYVSIWDGTDSSKNYTGGTSGASVAMTHQSGSYWVYTFTISDDDDVDAANLKIKFNGSGSTTSEMTFTNNGLYAYGGLEYVIVPDDEADIDTRENVGSTYFQDLDFESYDRDNVDSNAWKITDLSSYFKANNHYGDTDYTGYDSDWSKCGMAVVAVSDEEKLGQNEMDYTEYNVDGQFFLADAFYGEYADKILLSQDSKTKLPKGAYTLCATIDNGKDIGMNEIALYVKVGDEITEQYVGYGATSTSGAGKTWLTFSVAEESTVQIGIKTTENFQETHNERSHGNGQGEFLWLYADNFELYENDVNITVSNAQYATFYTHHSYVMPEGLEGSIITGTGTYEGEDTDVIGTLTITNTYSANDEVPGYTALLIHATSEITESSATFKGKITEMDDTEHTDAPEINYLYGSITDTETSVNGETEGYKFYMLSYGAAEDRQSTLGFFYGEEDGAAFTSQAHKAWLAIDNKTAAKFVGFSFGNVDGETTGITEVETVPAVSGAVYNLQGMRVNDMSRKGVYIVGGKKYIKK